MKTDIFNLVKNIRKRMAAHNSFNLFNKKKKYVQF